MQIVLDTYDEPESGFRVARPNRKSPRRADSRRQPTDRGGRSADDEALDDPEGILDPFAFYRGEGLIEGEGFIIKPGKEACVYRCRGRPPRTSELVAVKVYKKAERRSFKAMSSYLMGRFADAGINRRDSMHILSSPETLLAFWVESEFGVLERLRRGGLPVPEPYARDGASIAMEFIGGTEAAPRLQECRLSETEEKTVCAQLIDCVVAMLSLNTVHGDLSPYNVLLHDGSPRIIDFPQTVDPRFNANARSMLERDIRAILAYFSPGCLRYAIGPWATGRPDEDARRLTASIWARYGPRG